MQLTSCPIVPAVLAPAAIVVAAGLTSAIQSDSSGNDGSTADPILPCATTSADSFEAITLENGVPVGFSAVSCNQTPELAILAAAGTLFDSLIENSGIVCGPCEIPEACFAAPLNFSEIVTFTVSQSGIPFGPPWCASVEFAGKYEVTCTPCEA